MARAAALWALVFAGLHLVWACGWYPGLDPAEADRAFARPWFLAYDLVVGVACVVAAGAFAVVSTKTATRRRDAAHVICIAATVVVVMRAAAGLVARPASGVLPGVVASGWDLWFALGAVLFAAATWKNHVTQRSLHAGRSSRELPPAHKDR